MVVGNGRGHKLFLEDRWRSLDMYLYGDGIGIDRLGKKTNSHASHLIRYTDDIAVSM